MFVGQQYLLLPQVNDTPLHIDPEGGLIGFSCLTHVVGPPLIKSTNSMYPSSQVLQLVDEPSSHSLQFATLHPSLQKTLEVSKGQRMMSPEHALSDLVYPRAEQSFETQAAKAGAAAAKVRPAESR